MNYRMAFPKRSPSNSWQEFLLTIDPPAAAKEMTVWIWMDGGQGKGFIDEVKVEVVQ